MLFFRKEVQGPYEKAAALADEVLFAIRTVVPRTLVRWHDVFSGFLLNLRSPLVERRGNDFQIPSIKGTGGTG